MMQNYAETRRILPGFARRRAERSPPSGRGVLKIGDDPRVTEALANRRQRPRPAIIL